MIQKPLREYGTTFGFCECLRPGRAVILTFSFKNKTIIIHINSVVSKQFTIYYRRNVFSTLKIGRTIDKFDR